MSRKAEKHVYCTVAAIIERVHDNELEVLLQTRWKQEDTLYSGLLEIPGGVSNLGKTFRRLCAARSKRKQA
jgi:8-oxo-dGTP pyrophosphatase MutT (NUDIX family)